MQDRSCVMLFLKTPKMGSVKTRLERCLPANVVVELYRRFVLDCIRKIDGESLPLKIFYAPPDAGAMIQDWLGSGRDYAPQCGSDLGERMQQAFQRVFAEGVRRAVIVGSDIPDLPANIITSALSWLRRAPAVIGPSEDGGYYLIGFRADAFIPNVFENIPWSTETVLATTLDRFAKSGVPVRLAPKWRDIDTPEDLMHLINALKTDGKRAPETMAYLKKTGMTEDGFHPVKFQYPDLFLRDDR